MSEHALKNGLFLTIREAVPGDAERLLAYTEQVAGESENLILSPGELNMTVEQESQMLQEMLQLPSCLYLVAEMSGEIAGALSLKAYPRQRVRHAGNLGITVARACWNLGVGNHLMGEAIAWARASGVIRKINLGVRVDNVPAIHLYEKYGFVREGVETRTICIRGEFVDTYLMGLCIDPE